MSGFFNDYVQQMSLSLKEQTNLEIVSEILIANIGIINDVVRQADIVVQGNITLLPDFDSLPAEIREKLKKEFIQLAIQSRLMGTYNHWFWKRKQKNPQKKFSCLTCVSVRTKI